MPSLYTPRCPEKFTGISMAACALVPDSRAQVHRCRSTGSAAGRLEAAGDPALCRGRQSSDRSPRARREGGEDAAGRLHAFTLERVRRRASRGPRSLHPQHSAVNCCRLCSEIHQCQERARQSGGLSQASAHFRQVSPQTVRPHYRGLAKVYRCLHDLPHDVVLYGLGVQPSAERPSVRNGGSHSGHVPQARKGAHCIAPECLRAPSARLVITTCDTVKESQPAIAGRLRPRRALASC
jgi:hypothetical protein